MVVSYTRTCERCITCNGGVLSVYSKGEEPAEIKEFIKNAVAKIETASDTSYYADIETANEDVEYWKNKGVSYELTELAS